MKKVRNFEKVILFSTLSITLFTILLVNGCKKKNSEENVPVKESKISLVQMAKDYFTKLADNENQSSTQSSITKQAKNTNIRITPLLKMRPSILWENATEQDKDGFDYAIVPLKENIKPFKNKNYEFFRDIIFYQDKNKKANMIILEVLGKKNESLGTNLQKIAMTSFENKYFSQTQNIDALNASILFYNESYLRDTSFQVQNGKWLPARISFRSDLDISQ